MTEGVSQGLRPTFPLRLLCALAAFGVLLALVCLAPYSFPPRHAVSGASFELGFNNAVSYLFYLAFVGVPAFLTARLLQHRGSVDAAAASAGDRRLLGLTMVALSLIHVLLFVALYAMKGRFVTGESLYFQAPLHRMSLGEKPFLDFSFYYGPLMLYPAHWLARGLSLEAAYGVWFIGNDLLATWLLYFVVKRVTSNPRAVAFWTALISLGLFNPLAGVNVTLIRFLLATVIFFTTLDAIEGGRLRALVIAVATLWVGLTYTFDVAALGLAIAAGAIMVTLLRPTLPGIVRWFRRGNLLGDARPSAVPARELQDAAPAPAAVLLRGGLLLGVAGALAVGFFYAIDPTGRALRAYPEIAASYSAGAHNVPVYPNLPFLTLAAATVFALGAALRTLVSAPLDAATRVRIIGLTALAVFTQRGAFGVAEPTHIAHYGLPTFLLAIYVSVHVVGGQRLRRGLAVALAAFVMLPIQYLNATYFAPYLMRGGAGASKSAGEVAATPARPAPVVLDELVSKHGRERPYLMYGLEYYSLPVYRKHGLRFASYYTQMMHARTTTGMERVMSDLRAGGALVIAREADLGPAAEPPLSTGLKALVDELTGTHTVGSRLNAVMERNSARLYATFVDFLRREYETIDRQEGFVVLAPRPVAARLR